MFKLVSGDKMVWVTSTG